MPTLFEKVKEIEFIGSVASFRSYSLQHDIDFVNYSPQYSQKDPDPAVMLKLD